MINHKSYRDKTIAEFFDRNSEPANVDRVIHSTPFRKVNANGDPEFVGRKRLVGTDANGNKVYEKIKDDLQFVGRCYQGDGAAYIDVSSFVSGTLTAFAKYYNSGSDWIEDYEFTTEINNTTKRITLQNNHKAAHITIYEDAVLVAEYSGCEQVENGALLSDILIPNGNNATLGSIILSDFLIEDSTVPYSWLNEKGYSIGGSDEIIQAVRSSTNLGTDNNQLDFKGKLAPRMQLVNAPCLVLNGIDQKIQFSYEPTTIFLNGVDDTSNWTIADIGSGNWTIAPTTSKTVYDLIINSTRQYPCSENNGVIVYDVSGNNNHGTVTNAILPDIWGTQNVFHYFHVYGYWLYKDVSNNEVKIPIDAGASVTIAAVTFNRIEFIKGSNQGNKYNGASDFQFPDIPEITKELRGKVLSKDEIEGLKYARTILDDNGSLTLFKDKVESIHFLRKANRFLLDDYNTAIPSVASYKISSTFNDYCFLVVRESDMAEEAFYFDKYGLINEKDLTSFVGASNGRIKEWKDQSVSGLKYSNDTLSTMPYIVKSGVVCKDSRKIICPRFDGTEILSLTNNTQFKKLHDGTKYTSILDYQLDTGVVSYFIIGNSSASGQTGFSYLGNNFTSNALHVFIRSGAAIVVQDLSVTANIYNKAIRSVNVLDPSNGVVNQRLHTLIQEVERNGNASTGTLSSSDPTNGTVSIGKSSSFDMVGYISACIFIEGDYFVDRFKHSRSLIKVLD